MTEASIKQHDPLWDIIVAEAHQASSEEPLLTDFFRTSILNWSDLESALSYSLAHQLEKLFFFYNLQQDPKPIQSY